MADLSPEQIEALIDGKLRPLRARLEEHTRLLEALARRREMRWKRWLAGVSLLAVVAGVVIAGRALFGGLDSVSPTARPVAGRLLFADDFSTPAKGLFLDHQRGSAVLPGDRDTAQWSYDYRDGELVAHVSPPSAPLGDRVIGGSAHALNHVTGDFAVEVRARATAGPASAVYGLRFYPGQREFAFGLEPGQKRWMLWEIFRPPLLAATSSAVAPDEADNLLRMEVRGSAIRLFANGQLLDSLQDGAFAVRPADVGLFFDSVAQPLGDTVELRYSAFRVFSLAAG